MRGWIEQGYDVVALVPSCALMLKMEWPLIEPDDEDVALLAKHTYDISEYVVDMAKKDGLADGMDGLAGSISLIVTSAFGLLAWQAGQAEVATFACVVVGALLGFLIFNWPPAKIFMGDAGSMTLGFLVGALAMRFSPQQAVAFTLVAPTVLFSVPIFDTAMAILRRKLTGRGIGQADRSHLHHRLQDRGLSRLQTLLLIGSICRQTPSPN